MWTARKRQRLCSRAATYPERTNYRMWQPRSVPRQINVISMEVVSTGGRGAHRLVTDPDLHQNRDKIARGQQGARKAAVDAFGNAPNRMRVVRKVTRCDPGILYVRFFHSSASFISFFHGVRISRAKGDIIYARERREYTGRHEESTSYPSTSCESRHRFSRQKFVLYLSINKSVCFRVSRT